MDYRKSARQHKYWPVTVWILVIYYRSGEAEEGGSPMQWLLVLVSVLLHHQATGFTLGPKQPARAVSSMEIIHSHTLPSETTNVDITEIIEEQSQNCY
jgi:hypothetical protein